MWFQRAKSYLRINVGPTHFLAHIAIDLHPQSFFFISSAILCSSTWVFITLFVTLCSCNPVKIHFGDKIDC